MLSFYIFLLLCQKSGVCRCVWIDIWVFDLVPFVLLSVFMPTPGCFQYCGSVIEFAIRDYDTSRSSFMVQDCFGHPDFFAFPYEVEYCSFKVGEEFCWGFDGHCIEYVDFFW